MADNPNVMYTGGTARGYNVDNIPLDPNYAKITLCNLFVTVVNRHILFRPKDLCMYMRKVMSFNSSHGI